MRYLLSFVVIIMTISLISSFNPQKCYKDIKKYEKDLTDLKAAIENKDEKAIEKLVVEVALDVEHIKTDCTFTVSDIEMIKDPIDDLINCLEAVHPVYDDAKIIIDDIKSKNYDDFVDHIPETYHNAKKAYETCKKLAPHKRSENLFLN